MKLTIERGREFSVDRMDDEETLGMTFGAVVGGYQREHVVPELMLIALLNTQVQAVF